MRYLYFGDSNNALTVPADRLLGIDQTSDTELTLRFENVEGTADDTTVVLTIKSDSEKAVSKAISDGIVEGRHGSLLVVCDDVAGEKLSSDIVSVVINQGNATDTGLTAGSGIDGTATLYQSWTERLGGGIVKTCVFIDVTGLTSAATANDIIGASGEANAHIGKVETSICGTVFAGRVSSLSTVDGGATDVDLYKHNVGTLAESDAAAGTKIIDGIPAETAAAKGFAEVLPADGDFLYLAVGTAAAGTYTDGIILIELWGTV